MLAALLEVLAPFLLALLVGGFVALCARRFRALERSRELRRDVLAHLQEGVVVADPTGQVVDVNPAGGSILAGEPDSLIGRPLREVLTSLSSGIDAALLDRLVRGPGDVAPGVETRTADARRIEIGAARIALPGGRSAGRVVVLRDRTEERRFEEVVHRTQRLESLGLLAAGIAHEVNNPLAFVRANLVHLQEIAGAFPVMAEGLETKPDDDLRELPRVVEETLEGVERIARIVAGLRRLSRSDREEPTAVDVNEAVSESIKLAGFHRAPRVSLSARLSGSLAPVRGSKDRLIQVLLNLLLNARQALESGGRVLVETRRGEEGVEIRVEDDGPGMSEAVRQRMFDPFFTTKGPDGGTGLGLPIAHDIVREHGGWMDVASRPGEGTRFTIHLPSMPGSGCGDGEPGASGDPASDSDGQSSSAAAEAPSSA